MIGLLFAVLCGLAIVGLIGAMRMSEVARWRRELVAYRLRFPRGLKVAQLVAWLSSLPPWSRSAMSSVGFEVIATAAGIEHRLLIHSSRVESSLAQLQAALPGLRLELLEGDGAAPPVDLAAELRLTSRVFPLAVERAEASSAAILASLLPLRSREVLRLQWLVRSAPLPSVPGRRGPSAAWLDTDGVADSEQLWGLRAKQAEPLLQAVGRMGVVAATPARRRQLLGRVRAALSVMDAPGARVRPSWVPSWLVVGRLSRRSLPLFPWPMLLNAREAAGLMGIPLGDVELPGLSLGAARQLPAPMGSLTSGVLVAESDHPGTPGRGLRLRTEDRLQHLHVMGPTGVGKSTLLASLALQDIAAGRGVVVVDPKRDLVESILARVPERRLDDVVVLDPVDVERPVGLNVLGGGGATMAAELASEQVLGIFRELFADSWGPRTDDVLRAGLRTLTATRAANGSRFTLCELPELLGDPGFRRFVLGQGSVPESLRAFWSWFEAISEAERAVVIAPSLNKLRAFTTRTPIRLMVGQSEGFDLLRVFTERKIVLVPLSAGELGRPAAQLLGALTVASLWQVIRARTAIPVSRRHPVFVYLDEFQDVVRLPLDVADLLAQSRSLGVGLTLAHQHLDQLPRELRSAVLGTLRSRLVFQLGHEDARALERGFAPALSASDLSALEAYHVALRPAHRGQVLRAVTGRTRELAPATLCPGVVTRLSRGVFGVPRAEVEAGLRERLVGGTSSVPLGRKRSGP